MTGFGRGQVSDAGFALVAEIRSVNSRNLETSIRLPRTLNALEPAVGEAVQKRVSRGKVAVTVTLETPGGDNGQEIVPDLKLAEAYRQAIGELKQHLGMPDEVSMNMLLRMGDVVVAKQTELDEESARGLVVEAVEAALTELAAMRDAEGETLAADFRARLDELASLLAIVEERAPVRVEEAKTRLEERLEKLLSGDVVDEQRLAMEVAVIADRADITEECVRFRSHLDQFASLMEEEQAGRRLNFLLQELNREANTIGSKANDASIAHVVVQMKDEIERLREQVQNVE